MGKTGTTKAGDESLALALKPADMLVDREEDASDHTLAIILTSFLDGMNVSANFAAPCQRLRLLRRSDCGVVERQQIADIVAVGAAWQLG